MEESRQAEIAAARKDRADENGAPCGRRTTEIGRLKKETGWLAGRYISAATHGTRRTT